ncbi:MAG: beta-xylosidase, partial [Moritella sp.]
MTTILNRLETAVTAAKQTSHTVISVGLGIYASTLDKYQATVEQANSKYQALVEKGEFVEPKIKQQWSELTSQKMPLAAIQNQAHSIRTKVFGAKAQQLEDLEQKLDN